MNSLRNNNFKKKTTPPVRPKEAIKELEGCIKEGTPAIDPMDLKKIWEPKTKQAKN